MEANAEVGEALRKWLEDFSRVVENRDLTGTLQLFSSAAEVSHWPSESGLTIGLSPTEEFFRSLYDQPYTISWTWEPKVIAMIGDGAWLATDGEEIYTLGDEERRYPYGSPRYSKEQRIGGCVFTSMDLSRLCMRTKPPTRPRRPRRSRPPACRRRPPRPCRGAGTVGWLCNCTKEALRPRRT